MPQRAPRELPTTFVAVLLVLVMACPVASQGDEKSLVQAFERLYASGQYSEAIKPAEQLVALRERTLGPLHPKTAEAVNNLAVLYHNLGDYAKAESFYRRALQIYEKTRGPAHPDTATALTNIAEIYRAEADYARAEPLYRRALAILEKAAPDDPSVAFVLHDMAILSGQIGDTSQAETFARRALALRQKKLGPEAMEVGATLTVLGHLAFDRHDEAQSEVYFRRALSIIEKQSGPESPQTAIALNNLAVPLQTRGDLAQARALYEKALAILEKTLGKDHPEVATDLNNLASLLAQQGQAAEAEPLYARALSIRQKALGADHPDTLQAIEAMAVTSFDLHHPADALPFARQAEAGQRRVLSRILSFTPERQRLEYLKNVNTYSLFATLGSAEDLALAALRYKGIVLDSLLEDERVARSSKDPAIRRLLEQVQSRKEHLLRLRMLGPADYSTIGRQKWEAILHVIQDEADGLEADLTRRVAGLGAVRRGLATTTSEVQAALPGDAVLIEFLRCPIYLGREKWEKRYGAVLIPPSGEVRWIPLAPSAVVEDTSHIVLNAARGDLSEASTKRALQSLYDQVWAPLQPYLPPGTHTVILSPDAELNFVSFAVLLDADGRFLADRYDVRYVAGGRDLLRQTHPSSGKQAVLVGNPDFGVVSAVGATPVHLPALAGTAKECTVLESLARAAGWNVQTLTGARASEAAVRQVHSPRFLHLATHGFFLSDAAGQGNPMARSGLALAGAERTLQAWQRGTIPYTENDGILMAAEVGSLDLQDTWLVTLSACDTGRGEAQAGEGVMGLRRGFVQAGTQHLLMTLWPVSDADTVKFMEDFYRAVLGGTNPGVALAQVQRQWLASLRASRGLQQAVSVAGMFVMTFQGRP